MEILGAPEGFGLGADLGGPAGEDEEEVGEAVEVDEALVADRLVPAEGGDEPLGPAADGAGLVEVGADEAAAGEDERRELGEAGVQVVDRRLEEGDVARPR